MPKAEVTNETCQKCGVDVRENTAFCYNCGSPVTAEAAELQPQIASNGATDVNDTETRAALDDLADRFKIDNVAEGDDDKLAKAAAERRKKRIKQRQPAEFVWEPAEDSSSRVVILLAVLVAAIAAGVVFLTVYWK